MRGRKKQSNSYTETISIRITEEQKEILKKNEWMRKEIKEYVREYLEVFSKTK